MCSLFTLLTYYLHCINIVTTTCYQYICKPNLLPHCDFSSHSALTTVRQNMMSSRRNSCSSISDDVSAEVFFYVQKHKEFWLAKLLRDYKKEHLFTLKQYHERGQEKIFAAKSGGK